MAGAPDVVLLADLGITEDPGTNWHPRADKAEVRNADGDLVDLDDAQVSEHFSKPEADEQYDGVRRRLREARELGAAEDSDHSEPGEV